MFKTPLAEAAAAGPAISSLSPSANTTNVPLNTNLIIAFDENVRKGTGGATIQIRRQLDNVVFESYVVATDSKIAVGTGTNKNLVTITPSTNFALNTSYYVTIDQGAFANEGNGANFAGLTSAVSWSFTTIASADVTPPSLDTTVPFKPANGAVAGVSTKLTLRFSEPVYAANGNITVTNIAQPGDMQSISVNAPGVVGSSTEFISITLNNTLQGNSTYEVIVPNGSFQDASGNKFIGVSSAQWRFTTGAPPLGDPTLTPANNAYAVSVSTNLTLSFPGKVSANTGSITIRNIADNAIVQTIDANSGYVSYVPNAGGTDVIVNPPADLAPSRGFYVLIDAGAFKDTYSPSKQYQGISDARTWSFITDPGNDMTPPTLLADRKPLGTQATQTLSLEMNFSEPVYPGTGNIIIRSSPSGAVFASLPVTSDKVNGGGTSKITVTDASIVYVSNNAYYVEIGGQAFSDAKGNYFVGIQGSGGWQFTVTQDNIKPAIVAQNPASGATDVPLLGVKLEAMFSEPIQLGSNASAIKIKRIGGTAADVIAASFSIDPNNNSKLVITVNGNMAASTEYYVEIAAGAVTDMAGNAFDGILNQYQWTFRTSNSSTGAPSVTKADLIGYSKIAITFNKNLNNSVATTPFPANFYVTVNGAGRTITGVSISGQVVTLTLQTPAAYGQVIKVSYSAGTNPIKDLAGTSAANFSNINVTNVPDTTVPKQVSGLISGNIIILTLSEEIVELSPNAYSQFAVTIDGYSRSVTQISSSGSSVFLTISGNAVTIGQNVTLSYSPSSYPLRDMSNNALPAFSGFYILNGQDTKAPILQNITVSGAIVTLIYDEAMNGALVPPASSFYVTVNGSARSVYSVSVNGMQVTLTLASSTTAADVVLVSYVGGSPALTDLGGNSAPAFSGVKTGGSATTLALNGIIAKGSTVTISFASPLNTSYSVSTTQFSVKVNNGIRPVSSAAISGSSVVLSLYTPVGIGDAVKVSYSNNGVGPRSTTGAMPASFTDVSVANQTTWADNTGNDYEAAADGGLSIKTTAATTTQTVSPAGTSVNQFVLTAEKVTSAYNAIRSVGGMVPRVVFTVPSTENAASVALPLGALEDVKKATSNASIAVAYKSVTYEIPLSALNFTQLAQMMNAGGAVGQLIVSIDTNAGSLGTALTTQLNGTRAQTLVNPVSFELAVSSNGQTKSVSDFSGFVTRTIKTTGGLDGRQVSVVWMDPQTGKLSYAPTQVTQVGGQSVITFKRKGNSVYAVVKGAVSYTDLNKHWARNDILLLANKYIVEGSTLTAFAPDKAIMRGDFAMFIAKGLGLTGDRSAAAKFKDVNSSTVLAAYIGAASKAGIVAGMTDGSFKPNSPITREQMASMMVRAASAAGVQISLKSNAADTLKKFKDRGKIGTWAQSDVAKAVEAAIINGQTANTFGGKKNATRAEAAVMVKRLLAYVDFLDI
ncbi:Ig-like domain-containing protein [Paenibacillus sp. R14(2021)]|uniref:Ig-like domain-containing protein n=1 Tax=Paenibacillus sp. R14(2021) TaxID=2859228 RepID=UPI001C615747|nr:Ig-like domain-containing protein [Paenibacillus sp. R14(2021)]